MLEQVEDFKQLDDDLDRPFRMPLQDVYKFTEALDDRRIFVGTIETGRIRPGDDVVFLPSRKHSTVKTIEALSGPRPDEAFAGQATGLTLETKVYAKPGELLVRADQPKPLMATRIRANIFWMNTAPLIRGRRVRAAHGRRPRRRGARVGARACSTSRSSVRDRRRTGRAAHGRRGRSCGRCGRSPSTRPTRSSRPRASSSSTASIRPAAASPSRRSRTRAAATSPDAASARGDVSEADRAARYGHPGKAIVFVGESGEAAHAVAARVEQSVFALGVHSYCLSAADLGDDKDVLGREAHLARVGEIAWAMTDAGIVLVVALGDVDRFDLDRLRRLAAPHEVYVVGLDAGGELGADLELVPGSDAPTRRRRRRSAPSPPPASCRPETDRRPAARRTQRPSRRSPRPGILSLRDAFTGAEGGSDHGRQARLVRTVRVARGRAPRDRPAHLRRRAHRPLQPALRRLPHLQHAAGPT